MPELDASFVDRGPNPGSVAISLKSQADGNEGLVLTFGTADRTCAKCGATDYPIGWSAGKIVNGEMASVYPISCTGTWKCALASASQKAYFGDTLECAANGEVKVAIIGSGSQILGKAMSETDPGQYVIVMPISCCPTAASS